MSFADGWAAIHLQMPRRIPHTEYSVQEHWELIRRVTGFPVSHDSPPAERQRASRAFMRAWDFDFFWSTLIGGEEFGPWRTDMGHAEYAAGGVDRRDTIFSPFSDPEEVLAFDPWERLGSQNRADLVKRFEEHYRANCQANPDGVNMTGIYVTLISGLIDLFGWELLLLAAGIDPLRFGALADRYAGWIGQYFEALAEAEVPVVMIHDDCVWSAGAIFHPDWYRRFVFPNYRHLLEPLRQSGKKIMFTADGNYSQFIDDIAQAGVHGFVLEPFTDLAYLVEHYGQTHVIIGNADTRVLLTGSRAEIRVEVERCLNLGRGCPGYFLAVGNHIPANTPVENVLYYHEVYQELSQRA
jgi:hypothetical protein